jgi:hypothetical protein
MLNFAHGAVQWLTTDVLNTTIPVTGLGFTPKALRFYWVGLQSNSPTNLSSQAVTERRGVGFASSTTSRACVGTTSIDNAANADCGSIWSNTQCVITVDALTGTKDGALDINSIDTDGFTLIVDDVTPANITVFWEAWGGDEVINVTIGAIAEPAATGIQNYTATGFELTVNRPYQDQCVMFAGVQAVSATDVGEQQDSGLHVGFVTRAATDNNITVCGNSDDASATMDTDGYNFTGECISMIVIAGGNPNARASLSSFNTGVFQINWITRAVTNRRSIYMAIKGGQWQTGSTTIAGNTLNSTATVGNVPFNIRGVSLIGAMKTQSTIAVSTVQDRIGFGSGTSTSSRNSAAVLDENGTANAEINLSVYYDQVLVYPSVTGTLQTAYDISNLTANSLTLTTDTAGGVANEWIGYLIFGDLKRPVSVGHPFIA